MTSDACAAPITAGALHPVVILPSGWTEWPESQLNAVLAHENEHARRRDPLVQWLGLLNRAVFWFHPLSWWLARRLSALAEEACDDAVLSRGHDPVQYSECLLDLARVVQESGARLTAVAMAMPGSNLPHRIRRIVAAAPVPRMSRTRKFAVAATCAMLSTVFTAGAIGYYQQDAPTMVSTPVAPTVIALDPQAGEIKGVVPPVAPPTPASPTMLHWKPTWKGTPGMVLVGHVNGQEIAQITVPGKPTDGFGAAYQSFTGTVQDPSGAVVPNALITLTGTDNQTSSSITTDVTGTYQFQNVQPGTYNVSVQVPGFKRETQTNIRVAPGEPHNGGRMILQVGSIMESITVTGSRSAPVASQPFTQNTAAPRELFAYRRMMAQPTTDGPLGTGGLVQAAHVVRQIKPVYPMELQQQGVQGTVRIEAILSKEGVLSDIRVISVDMNPALAPLAVDAVRQSRYEPTLLNGEPVEVMTTIDVNFVLAN